jgi:hypothetical protein
VAHEQFALLGPRGLALLFAGASFGRFGNDVFSFGVARRVSPRRRGSQ